MAFVFTNENLRSSVKDYLLNDNPNKLPPINDWDVSNVTNMEKVFKNCTLDESTLDEKVDLNKWNVSKVTSMRRMFLNCKGLTGDKISEWNFASVTNMKGMFRKCADFKPEFKYKLQPNKKINVYHMFVNTACGKNDKNVQNFLTTPERIEAAFKKKIQKDTAKTKKSGGYKCYSKNKKYSKRNKNTKNIKTKRARKIKGTRKI